MFPGYEPVEELPGTDAYRLLRARRVDTGAPVLIKAPLHDPPRVSAVEALRRESDLLAKLAIGGVPRPLGFADGRALVIEDLGGSSLTALLRAGPLELGLTLAIGIQMAAILTGLHRHGLIHGAIRPEIIYCDGTSARAWMIDFSDVRGDGLAAPSAPLGARTARLIYAAPEQTGRMNRTVDQRSDIYSLGVVLYEMLTGAPPFRSEDALELIHWHIARMPTAPAARDAEIPAPVSNIVMKLLAKTAEDRYLGAAGLKEDLEICAREWAARKRIAAFTLGARDARDQFIVSQKLYGREAEVALLVNAFERVCSGESTPAAMMLVAGYSGIGKTALIQELYKPIVRQRGYFIAGKFDQVVRNIPFGALIQALRALVMQLLTESEARLAAWRSAFLQALGTNGGVLAEVIPEIEFIIGKQPLTVVLGPTEALNRFRMVFQNFVAALARLDHPLVVFLDDLQWADAATLDLLEPLLTSQEIQCLFFIGAYRDNEVDAAHPLIRTFGALESAGVAPQRVTLGPLRLPDLTRLIGDTLHSDLAYAEALAQLTLKKTAGNPFFVTQFLKTLNEEGYFRFDLERGHWTYRIDAIAAAPLTDNVIDLMTRKIRRLPPRTQHALRLAACIGNPFDSDTLAVVSEQPAARLAEELRDAVNQGLISPAQGEYGAGESRHPGSAAISFAFSHDRIQQSAYALIPDEQKSNVHLTVGRLLRSKASQAREDDWLFDILHHLNLGRGLITDNAERLEVARLNLAAGRKAKSSTAHEAALNYLQTGLSLLRAADWSSDYALAFELHLESAESEYLNGHFDVAESRYAALLRHAATSLDQARVYRLRSLQYENMARYADALASAREALALFGISFPDTRADKEAALEAEIATIQSLLRGRAIAALVNLPVMADPAIRMVMHIMTDIWASAYLVGDPVLARLLSATMVRLSLSHGNVEESAYGYVTHAITVGPVRGDYQSAYEFGTLALSVNERFNDKRRRAKICQQFHAHVNFWRQPMRTCIPYAREACRSGLEHGDFLYAAYGAGTELWSALLATQDLAQFVRDYAPNVALIKKLKNTPFADSVKIILNWARALQGKTSAPLSLSDDSIDENDYLRTYRDNAFFTTFHAVARLQLCYVFGEYAQALEAARTARAVVYQLAGTVWPLIFDFWNALTLAANYAAAREDERPAYREELRQAQQSFALLAENCPENFLCQSLLLAAEFERLEGRTQGALELYERAIGYAAETGMRQQLALANELCGRFRLAREQPRIAALFLAEAQACYARWGATAVAEELARRYRDLLGVQTNLSLALPVQSSTAVVEVASRSDSGALDLVSVMKAARALTGEIELDRLLAKLMRIAIENAGAERASLLLEHGGEWLVQAEGSIDAATVYAPDEVRLAEASGVPVSMVNYVWRTSESVFLADAQHDERFGADVYIAQHQPRSVMCVPVRTQGRLVGILYLENNQASGAFTPDRVQIVQLLAAEAAISLENARLVNRLKQEIQERAQAQAELRATLTEVERLKNELEAENTYLRRDLIVNVSHDLRTPLTSLRGYVETLLMKHDLLTATERHGYLEIAARQSERLATLVDELFELARLDFKGLQLHLEPLQLGEFAHDVLQKFRLTAEQKQVSLSVEAGAAVPPIGADVGMLERVFDNLIGNALKHTPAGGRISVSIAPEGERVRVRVADNGSGIPQADIPFIFDRFYRVDKSRGTAAGSAGLGLAITKRILELHEGEITVESEPSAGTCFSFSLPVRWFAENFAA